MPYLKLCRDEPEHETPPTLPFRSARSAEKSGDTRSGGHMDSITQAEVALRRVEETFDRLSGQVEEFCEPIRMADWLESEDDGPWAA